MLLALVMVLGMIPTFSIANAASSEAEALGEIDIYTSGDSMDYLVVNGQVKKQDFTYYLYTGANGQQKEIPAYCVNPYNYGVSESVDAGQSIRYIANEKASDPKITGIVANGYPTRGFSELKVNNKFEAYYATKTALWCYLLSTWDVNALKVNPNCSDQAGAQRVLAAVKDIYARGTTWTSNLEPSVTCTPDQDVAYDVTIDGVAYKQQIFTVTSKTWICNYAVRISFAMPDEVPNGTRIVDMDNRDITTVTTGENSGSGYQGQFKVLYPADSITGQEGSIQLALSLDVYSYAIFYAVCAETGKYGDLQNYMAATDPTTPVRLNAYSTYGGDPPVVPDEPDNPEPSQPPVEPEPEPGSLRIVKLETGTEIPLAGAVFEVVGPNGDTIGSFATNANGEIFIPDIEAGNYTVYERFAPQFHLLSENDTQNVTVPEGGTATVTFYNDPYGNLRVEKVSDTGENLEGVTVQIRNIVTGETRSAQTGPGGAAYFERLVPGAYEVRETAGIKGWIANTETVQNVTVVSGETSTVTIVNKELPGLRIIKYDRATMEILPGVTFRIWKDGQLLGDFTTNALGQIVITDAEPGTYLVQEVQSDDAHITETTPRQVELQAGDGIVELVFFNSMKPGIHLVKVDSADLSIVIPNVRFRIEAVAGGFSEEFVTDINGEIDLSRLEPGAYVVTELECPGYIVDDAQRIIQLEADQTAQFVFTNSKNPDLHLVKLSADGTALAGVSFRLAKIEDGSRYLDRTTDQNGEIVWEGLEPGVYSLQEIATLDNYIMDLREYHVELFPGRVSTVVLENDRRPSLTIYKRDADTGEVVPDTVFEVRGADGHSVTEVRTDNTGKATVENLLPGVYQVTEKSVPSPYLLDAESQLVTLYPNREHTVYFENHKKPTLTISKVDIGGAALPGAIFEVKTKAGVVIGDFTTGPDGKVTIPSEQLDEGYYLITEKQAPAGFVLDPTPHEVYLRPGKTTEITIENEKKPGLTIQKIDSVVGDGIKGAKFEIWVSKDQGPSGNFQRLKDTFYYTDEYGRIELYDLDTGWYKIVEVEPAAGFMMKEPSEQTVYVEHDASVVVTFENIPKSALIIRKIDADTGAPLANAWFRVRYLGDTSGTGGTIIGEYATSADGNIVITGLDAGTYIVEEISAPKGYVMDTAPQTAYISGKEQDCITLTFTNSHYGSLLIKKVDAVTGEPLSDVQFFVTDSGGSVIGNSNGYFTTDSAGTILIPDIMPGTTLVVKEARTKPGYILDEVPQTIKVKVNETMTLEFRNQPEGNLIIEKKDSVTGEPLEGVQFKITYSDGSNVDAQGGQISSNGLYWTDENGQIIIGGITGTVVVTEIQTIPGYVIHEETRSQTVVVNPNDTQTLYFYNDPIGGVEIVKVSEADKSQRIPNVTFEIRRADDALVDIVTTDENGRVFITLEDGAYYAVELECPRQFKLDPTPHYFEVKNGETVTLTITNQPLSGIMLHKIDANTKDGIYGAVFLLYDENRNPLGQHVTDQNGWIYINDLAEGCYYLREMECEGYVVDEELKTVYVEAGSTVELEWENTPITGTIQITKTSADYNPTNGKPAGTPLAGTVFEIYDLNNQLVDTIETDQNGIAVSKSLPLGRYVIRETKATELYLLNETPVEVEIEHADQTVGVSITNKSINANVSITKTGYKEVMAGQTIRYDFADIGNNSNVALESFYWRDVIPTDALRLDKIVTGTYSAKVSYKVIYQTNLSNGSYYTMNDSLSSDKNYTLEASTAALGLASNEYVTEFMLVFDTVPAGFHQVEAPQVYCFVLSDVKGGSQFTNVADVGGVFDGQWQQAVSRWVTDVYSPTKPLPRTGY